MSQNQTLDLNNFQIIQSIKDNVFLIENKETKTKYIACVEKTSNDENSDQNINVSKLQSYFDIQYPSVLKFYGYSTVDFDSNPYQTYIIEYAPNGSLQDVFNKLKASQTLPGFTNTKKYIITIGIALGINFFHSKNIFLGNLQPSNIFLDDQFYPLINTFDFIRDQSEIAYYKAPETFSEQSNITSKSDVFSFASIVFDMIDLSKVNEENKIFFNKCMSENPSDRLPFSEVINYITRKSFVDLFNNVDINEISIFLKKLIDSNDSDALYMIACILLLDDGRRKEAFDYFKLSADQGNSYSMYQYGKMLHDGECVEVNFPEALRYFKMSADKENHYGLNGYGLMLLRGEGCAVDVEGAIHYFKAAIEKGDVTAMYNYAMMFFDGKAVPMNRHEAAIYFKMTADHNHPSSAVNYAALSYKGDGVPMNKTEALRYFKKAADLDYDEGLFRYAVLIEQGIGGPANKYEAARCFKLLADRENPKAMYRYGGCFIGGKGIPKNVQEGVRYLKMAIDKGHDPAMHDYAFMLIEGKQIPQNVPESIRYFKMAADNGFGESLFTLGLLNHRGQYGVKINKMAAIHYYKLAVAKGNVNAMLNIGEMLWNGDGVQVNKAGAIHYLNMAMERGNEDARRILNSMEYKPCTIC